MSAHEDKSITLMVAGEPTGPFSAAELCQRFAAGELTRATHFMQGEAEGWRPLIELPEWRDHANATRPAVTMAAAPAPPKPYATFDHALMLVVLLLIGMGTACYFGFFFDTAREGVNNIGLLNDRLCGVIGGCTICVIATLLLVVQGCCRIVSELRNRK